MIKKFKARRFQEVINQSIVLLKKQNNDYLWNILGLCHQNLNSYEKSIECFNNALNINNSNIAVLNNLGISYKNLKEYSKSEEYFNKVLAINPKYINALVNLGNLKMKLTFLTKR